MRTVMIKNDRGRRVMIKTVISTEHDGGRSDDGGSDNRVQ